MNTPFSTAKTAVSLFLLGALAGLALPASAVDVIIGDTITEVVNISSGTTPYNTLILGNQALGDGTLNFSGGTIDVTHPGGSGVYSGFVTVGNSGTGTINHSNFDGDAVINITGPIYVGPPPATPPDSWGGYLFLGRNDGSTGSYTMTDTASGFNLQLNVQNEIQIGGSNVSTDPGGGFSCFGTCSGSFQQDGGSVTAGGVTIGINTGVGSYTINSGTLNSFLDLGNTSSGDNQFNQNGATTTVNLGGMFIANGGSSNGTYTLNDGTLNSGSFADIGLQGTGTFTQGGGIHNAGDVSLGFQSTGIGTYNLDGGAFNVGTATTGSLLVGDTGQGVFNMTGGTLTINNNDINTAAFVVGNQSGSFGTFTQSGGDVSGGRALAIGLNGGTGTYNLNTGTSPTLDTGFISLGFSGTGVFNQQDGTTNNTGSLFIGADHGTYNQFGGDLNVGGQGTIVGTFGIGEFNQSGGTHTTAALSLGQHSGSVATYTLTGGDLVVTGQMFVGKGDNNQNPTVLNGLFQQSGGTTVTAAQIFIGGDFDGTNSYFGTGRYELSGGTVNSQFTPVGYLGQGQVLQTGGTFNAGELQLGSSGLFSTGTGTLTDPFVFYSSGTYDLQDGVLNTSSTTVSVFGQGTFNQSGTSQHVVTNNLVVGSQPGLIEPNSGVARQGIYTMTGGLLDVGGNTIIGAGNGVNLDPGFPGEPGALGTFTQSGGNHQVGGNLIIGQSGNVNGGTGFYNLSAGSLTVSGDTFIGGSGLPDGLQDGTGTFTQTGGTVTIAGAMTVGLGQGTGTYNLSSADPINNSAVLNTSITYLSADNSTFNQNSGTHNTGFLNVYGGHYNLSAGTINVAGNMGVGGPFNSATFHQTGGDVFVNNPTFGLYVGGFPSSGQTGTYTLDDGTLTVVATTHVGSDAVGTFNQNGGVHTSGQLILGGNASGNGTYNLSGGTLNDNAIIGDAGTGVFNNSGGTHNVSGDLVLGNLVTGNGTYSLSGTGTMTQTGGGVIVGREGAGNLSVANTGSFTSGADIVLGSHPGGTGIATVGDAGLLTTGLFGQLVVGQDGNGTFTQNGTSVVTAGGLRVGGAATSTSTYTMDGGTLNVYNTAGVTGGSRIGLAGTGTFTQNGGTYNTTFMEIGGTNFAQGNGGTGTYNLNGGTLVASGTIYTNPQGGSQGILNVAGGSLSAPTIINSDQVNYSGGTIAANLINNADFNVLGGATRTLTGNLTNNAAGIVNVAVGSPLTITGVLTNATTATITAGSNITIGKDYNNLASGSGNAFDRRANVTGAGQIIGSNASQTIAGSVVNAGTDTWTLNIGNVRGGSGPVTQNYQITNNGTGADIRGAIQTTGLGNVTDGRLSGSGVTEGNFGPIAAGGNSGNLSVTLTGPGAALIGQKVAVVSNFDNVATQVINITGGAVSALAVGNATPTGTPTAVDLGNFRVGSAGTSSSFDVQNQTSGAGAEQLGINSVVASSGFAANNAFGGGLIGPGATQTGAVTAKASGSGTAGVNTGTVTIQYATDGTAIDASFTREAANQQVINVQATGYNVATGNATPAGPINLGNFHVGQGGGAAPQNVNIDVANQAPATFSEQLGIASANVNNAAFALTNNLGTNLVNGGSTASSALNIARTGGTAGLNTGTIAIQYTTDGTNTSGLAAINTNSQNITVNATGYNLAQSNVIAPVHIVAHVGDGGGSISQALTITNTAPVGAFSEGLNSSFGSYTPGGGDTLTPTFSGSITNLAAGSTDNTSMTATISTATAGLFNGSVVVNQASNGTISGLVDTPLAAQNVGVSGNVSVGVFTFAQPTINTAQPLNFGNVRISTSQPNQAISISNTAPVASTTELLNGSFVSAPTGFTGSGSFSGLAPGAAPNSNIQVGIDTSTAGAKSGTVVINFVSDGTTIVDDGTTTNLGNSNVAVQGNVYRLATGNATPAPLDLGNFRLASPTVTGNLAVQNTAANDGSSEQLGIQSVTPSSGLFTASNNLGSTRINAQGTAGNAITVGLGSGLQAGVNNGSVGIQYLSDGTVSGTGAPINSNLQNVAVSATGYRLANPTLNTPSVTIAARVGDPAVANQAVSITNTSPDIYTEGLKVDVAGATGNAQSNGGGIANLAANGTDNGSIKVGLASTAVAGNTTGQVNLALSSTGAGTTGAADFSLGTEVVNVVGKVYQQAVALVNTAAVNFGIVHVSDVVAAQNVSVKNNAPLAGLNDVLTGSISAGGPFSGSGNLAGLAAGFTDASSLMVGLNTSTAGSFNGNATLGTQSHNADMTDLALADQLVSLSATVNNYAVADLSKTGGTGNLSGGGNTFTLDFGNLLQGTGTVDALLEVLNNVSGQSDLLKGSFDLTTVNDFIVSGFGDFSGLGAGGTDTGLSVGINTSTLGSFTDQITLFAHGYNSSGYSDTQDLTLILKANVVSASVPEPGSLALVGIALLALLTIRRRSGVSQRF
jgi:hypothetical protein